jgi:Ca2+-binding EF-hand superfamily protein
VNDARCNAGSFNPRALALETTMNPLNSFLHTRLARGAAVAALALTLSPLVHAQQPTEQAPKVESAEQAFKRADANGDGKLSKTEAARLPAIADRFDALDTDKDGFLSMGEFMTGFSAK